MLFNQSLGATFIWSLACEDDICLNKSLDATFAVIEHHCSSFSGDFSRKERQTREIYDVRNRILQR